jgi:CRP-like cAMP-binding protein
MASSDYLDHLANIRLFNSCSQRELAKIARATDEVHVPVGKVLMEQGQSGREAFIIVSGTASVVIGGTQVAELSAGHHVGELALLDGGPRTATVTATTDMDVLVISQRAFFALLDEVPGLARKILTSLACMVRDLDERLGTYDAAASQS